MRPSSWSAPLALVFGLALAACASQPPRVPAHAATPVAPVPPRPAACATCGRVERIDAAPAAAGARPRGAVLGGVVGGVLSGPAPAPPAKAGNASSLVRLVVLLDSGRRLILTQPPVAGMRVGSRVRVERSRALLLR